MTHTKPTRPRRQGRIFPEFTIPPEELARREDEKNARCQKAHSFFEQVASELIDDHYNWFIIIEPNSGDYFIDPEEEVAIQKARQKYPSGWIVIFLLEPLLGLQWLRMLPLVVNFTAGVLTLG